MKSKLRRFGARLRAAVGAVFYWTRTDGLILSGLCIIGYGAWLVYSPAGVITGGLALVACGWIQGGRKS